MDMIIDTHNHLWRCEGEYFSWIAENSVIRRDFLIEDLKHVLAANHVSGSLLVQAMPTLGETRWLLDIAKHEPIVKGVIGWVDVAAGAAAVARDLDALLSHSTRLKGIRYMSQGLPPAHLLETHFVEGVREIGRHNLVYELLITPQQLEAAEALIENCPGVRFVIEHIAKPDIRHHVIEPWRSLLMRIARQHENVCCKLSGMVTEADPDHWTAADIKPYMTNVFEAFGPDRVMFGSDWPVSLLAASYERVIRLCEEYVTGNPALNRNKFFALNAQALYGLSHSQESHIDEVKGDS